MHVLFRETHGLDEAAVAKDLGQTPADLVVLSFSDSDLGAFAAGWQRGQHRLPSLRLANLSDLRHPLSVDTYIDSVLSHARAILVRLIGGRPYWSYGMDQLAWLARKHKIALAILPGDGNPDDALDEASTLPLNTLRHLGRFCEAGGEIAAEAALALLAESAGLGAFPVAEPAALQNHGFWHSVTGPTQHIARDARPLILIPFYRAWAVAADTKPIAALIRSFERRGYQAVGIMLPGLKDPAASLWLAQVLPTLNPAAIVNATAFSGQGDGPSPLDCAGVPVFQLIHATSTRDAWQGSDRGLSAADLAMHVALPELDGRIQAGIVSFKARLPRNPALQIALQRHEPADELIARCVEKVCSWIALQKTGARPAFVLSTYPGKAWRMAHAVGLDAIGSVAAMLGDDAAPMAPEDILLGLQQTRLEWSVPAYQAALQSLSPALRQALDDAHGSAVADPSVQGNHFRFAAFWHHERLIALQPERGATDRREAEYHDQTRVPCHGYVAFYLWLREVAGINVMIHVGAHGTLEWLPGKSAGLGPDCWPEALTQGMPILYPFIVSDPGEAASARRRLGAVTLGHLPPPMAQSALSADLVTLEQLLDEYSIADGLDPARRDRLVPLIRREAQARGVEADLGLTPDIAMADAITAIDSFVCEMKESQYGAGLHIWGRGCPDDNGGFTGDQQSIRAEGAALQAGLAGSRIAAGPSGSPWRGRLDVLPTGRNLYGVDPRAVPSRTAYEHGRMLADELIRRHLQDHGDYPKGLMLNLWGSATMRTAGEDYAMALHLAGVTPLWDPQSERVTGFEVTPLPMMDWARIDVTLRISGLFRDTFPHLVDLFDQACAALAKRDEAPDQNPYPYAPQGARIFAPRPGQYGTGTMPEGFDAAARAQAATAWLAASAYDSHGDDARQALEARIAAIDTFVLTQDLPESDLLLAEDYASHIGGYAAAHSAVTGRDARLYHLDTTIADRPKARSLREELARIIRARATQAGWLRSMQRHGFRGAAEIAATLDHLAAFARLTGQVAPHLFASYHAATLGDPAVRAFLAEHNPEALATMERLFHELGQAGLWVSGSNSHQAGAL